MGRITKSKAKAIREAKIEKYAARNPFQAPVKGVDCGAMSARIKQTAGASRI